MVYVFISVLLCIASLVADNVTPERIVLPTPDLSDAKIVRCSVGLRPYRTSGLRLEAETIGDKLIIHDYGHGGAGISLSWGCAQQAVSLMHATNYRGTRVAVIGAGVIGLTTAHLLRDQGYEVTVYAREFVPYTTSNRAAGLWGANFAAGAVESELFERIRSYSYEKFHELAVSEHPAYKGVFILPTYRELAPDALPADNQVAVEINGRVRMCRRSSNIVFDLNIYMQDLFDKAVSKGIAFEYKDIASVDDILQLPELVIFNCTGLGSRDIFHDTDVIPVKGHLVIFEAQPDIQFIVSHAHQEKDLFFSLIPWKTQIVLGGTLENGVDTLDIDPSKVTTLLHNARAFFNLANA